MHMKHKNATIATTTLSINWNWNLAAAVPTKFIRLSTLCKTRTNDLWCALESICKSSHSLIFRQNRLEQEHNERPYKLHTDGRRVILMIASPPPFPLSIRGSSLPNYLQEHKAHLTHCIHEFGGCNLFVSLFPPRLILSISDVVVDVVVNF